MRTRPVNPDQVGAKPGVVLGLQADECELERFEFGLEVAARRLAASAWPR